MARNRIFNLANFQQFTAINVLSDPGHIGGPVVIPNAVKVMLVWQLANGKLGRQVLGGIKTSFSSASQTVAENVRAAIVGHANFTAYIGHITSACSFLRVEIQDVTAPDLPVFASTGVATPGTGNSTPVPDEIALVLTLRTGGIGQQNRGRAYFSGFDSAQPVAGGVAAAALVTALGNLDPAIRAGMTAGGLQWGLMKPQRAAYTGSTGTQHPARGASIIPITTTIVRDNHWDSQRRRGLK
jgi:hypothetical protein